MHENSHQSLLVESSLSGAAWQQLASVYPLAETERRAEGLAVAADMPLALAYYLAALGRMWAIMIGKHIHGFE